MRRKRPPRHCGGQARRGRDTPGQTLAEPGDSDANGLSDSDSTHSLILTYSDKNQVVRDVYWTKTFVGQNDCDNLLEAGEKVELNVRLTAQAHKTIRRCRELAFDGQRRWLSLYLRH